MVSHKTRDCNILRVPDVRGEEYLRFIPRPVLQRNAKLCEITVKPHVLPHKEKPTPTTTGLFLISL